MDKTSQSVADLCKLSNPSHLIPHIFPTFHPNINNEHLYKVKSYSLVFFWKWHTHIKFRYFTFWFAMIPPFDIYIYTYLSTGEPTEPFPPSGRGGVFWGWRPVGPCCAALALWRWMEAWPTLGIAVEEKEELRWNGHNRWDSIFFCIYILYIV